MVRKFCVLCGKKLEESFVLDHFDRVDGEPLYCKFFTCPSRRWWNFFAHDKYLQTGGSFGDAAYYYTKDYVTAQEAKNENNKRN